MKPEIICHMMSTIDGRQETERWSEPFDGKKKEDLFTPYFDVRGEIGVTHSIIGRTTVQKDFQVNDYPVKNKTPADKFESFVADKKFEHTFVVMDSKGRCGYEKNDLEGSGIIAVLGENVSAEYLAHLRSLDISYVFAGKDGRDLNKAMNALYRDFKIEKINLEGGGTVNGSFLDAGLIDEFSILIYPGVDGLSGVPAIVDYKGASDLSAKKQSREFLSVKVLDYGIVWLRYKVHRKS